MTENQLIFVLSCGITPKPIQVSGTVQQLGVHWHGMGTDPIPHWSPETARLQYGGAHGGGGGDQQSCLSGSQPYCTGTLNK